MPHLYLDNSYYFITCRTKDKRSHLLSKQVKTKLKNIFNEVGTEYHLSSFTYAILHNHYHFLAYVPKGDDVKKIMQKINGKLSHHLNLGLDRRLWSVYYDSLALSKHDRERIIAYILGNPLKHNVVKDFNELYTYPFCSYGDYVDRFGEEFVFELISKSHSLYLDWERL